MIPNDFNDLIDKIQNINPADKWALTEINVRVWCWLENYTLETMDTYEYGEFTVKERQGTFSCGEGDDPDMEYSRSRDALKNIRPKGWRLSISHGNGYMDQWVASLEVRQENRPWWKFWSKHPEFIFYEVDGHGDTEELAELSAILQAINYDRDNPKV